MPRLTPEWIGRTDDARPPPRVRLRVFVRDDGRCRCGCERRITVGDRWETDHAVALVNGGENRESNLVTLLKACHDAKTKRDVAEKAAVYGTKAHHLGIRRTSRPMPGGRRSPWKKKMNGQVVRR